MAWRDRHRPDDEEHAVSDRDVPDLQRDQDPDEPETRRDEVEGEELTPMAQTDLEQDDRGSTSPGDQDR